MKEIIKKKGYAVGTFLGISNVQTVECLSYTGLDFVIIDTEHGPYDTETMSDMVSAAEKGGMVPVVRVADVTHKEIQRAVDNGARGLIVPCLKTIDEFKKVVELAKFAPIGNRGFIKARGSGYGNESWAAVPLKEYMKNCNKRVLTLPQCETAEALENIEEIVQIEGIDGIFIGPFDLSIALGIPAEFDNPKYKAAVERIKKACHEAGKLCMIFAASTDAAKAAIAQKMDAVAVGIDSIVIKEAYSKLVEEVNK